MFCATETYCYSCMARPRFSYKVCPHCGFTCLEEHFVLPPELEKLRYLQHHNSIVDTKYVTWLQIFVTAITPYLNHEASILDFGSGPNPVLAELLAGRGFRVSLYDPYFAPDTDILYKQYKAIIIHEVIEHLENPFMTLQVLIPLLAPEGFFAIRTQVRPDSDDAFDTFWYRKDQTHRSFFMEKTLFLLAEQLTLTASKLHKDIFLMKKQ